MCFQVGLAIGLISLEIMSLYHIFENALNVGIEHLHGQFATLGSLEYGLILLVLTRLQHIVASQHSSNGIVASIPVAHKHTLPAPLIAHNGSKQFTVLHSVWTIQLIIRGHNRPRITLLYHYFKSLQVYFTECTLRHLRDIVIAVCFLIVSHKMLRTGSCALALHATHIPSSNRPRKIRILRIILMVATAQRVTNQVHGGRKNPVEPELTHLVTDALPYLKGSLAIPSRSQRHRSHKIRRIVITMIPGTGGIHTQALLRVGTIGFGYP